MVRKALEQLDGKTVKDIEFYFTGIEDPKIKVKVLFKIDSQEPKDFMIYRHKAIVSIFKTFGESNIVKIAVPEHKN
jgi:small conductance mechanosensitive channel